uniref:Alpha-(1,6)-fucosyltransferase n=1 Tax=Glossina austeni TaxID=7395 RepID=A0A1A9VF78_GLOAU
MQLLPRCRVPLMCVLRAACSLSMEEAANNATKSRKLKEKTKLNTSCASANILHEMKHAPWRSTDRSVKPPQDCGAVGEVWPSSKQSIISKENCDVKHYKVVEQEKSECTRAAVDHRSSTRRSRPIRRNGKAKINEFPQSKDVESSIAEDQVNEQTPANHLREISEDVEEDEAKNEDKKNEKSLDNGIELKMRRQVIKETQAQCEVNDQDTAAKESKNENEGDLHSQFPKAEIENNFSVKRHVSSDKKELRLSAKNGEINDSLYAGTQHYNISVKESLHKETPMNQEQDKHIFVKDNRSEKMMQSRKQEDNQGNEEQHVFEAPEKKQSVWVVHRQCEQISIEKCMQRENCKQTCETAKVSNINVSNIHLKKEVKTEEDIVRTNILLITAKRVEGHNEMKAKNEDRSESSLQTPIQKQENLFLAEKEIAQLPEKLRNFFLGQKNNKPMKGKENAKSESSAVLSPFGAKIEKLDPSVISTKNGTESKSMTFPKNDRLQTFEIIDDERGCPNKTPIKSIIVNLACTEKQTQTLSTSRKLKKLCRFPTPRSNKLELIMNKVKSYKCKITQPTVSISAIAKTLLIWICLASTFLIFLQPDERNVMTKGINQALQLLEITRQRNQELERMIGNLLGEKVDSKPSQEFLQKLDCDEPSLEYELMRRRIQNNIGELWNYFRNELGKIRKNFERAEPKLQHDINSILVLGAEHKRSLLSDMERMRELDGYEVWRHEESKNLSDLVQKRLHYLQNPADCSKARKLVCELNQLCDYGCQLHHVVYCFIVAYATERTLILKSQDWRYNKYGWKDLFHPVSDSCVNADEVHADIWPGRPDSQTLILPVINCIEPRPPYLPPAIPKDLASRVRRLHGDPTVWWAGQFLKYLLRPRKKVKNFLITRASKLGWSRPIVGVHVRRTDKLKSEAALHSIEEYMTHVEDYFLTLESTGTTITRRIFLATDDAQVIDEARKKYPHYKVVGDSEVARLAGVSTQRHTGNGLYGIISDIHLLSLSDYLVCTFSSNVCRVAYEIMQTLYPDAGHRFKSLDDVYYYGGQNSDNYQVIIAHEARNHDEIHMRIGDIVEIAGNLWNGFSKGKNMRTNQSGLFPSFKVNDKVETVNLPTYLERIESSGQRGFTYIKVDENLCKINQPSGKTTSLRDGELVDWLPRLEEQPQAEVVSSSTRTTVEVTCFGYPSRLLLTTSSKSRHLSRHLTITIKA